jgi:hypothetical protein
VARRALPSEKRGHYMPNSLPVLLDPDDPEPEEDDPLAGRLGAGAGEGAGEGAGS